jgi:hypothetical protein
MFSPSYGTVAMDQSPIAEGHGGRNIGNDRVPAGGSAMTREGMRLQEARDGLQAWREWGPYLSERQWGTVREDYSDSGDAWNYFTHDQARSRTYRWGEDGIAGISDDKQILCFAVALWNGKDPILKERMFGLTNSEGNHGEDVKEYYFYSDNTPTHSYMRYLYKYPHAAYPYEDLVLTNRRRNRDEMEYELIDTGIFDQDRYFDVVIEYAKESAKDIAIRISATNRGPEPAALHLLPTLWFRQGFASRVPPSTLRSSATANRPVIEATDARIGSYCLYFDTPKELLFTENESNTERLFGRPNVSRYVKDAFHDYLVHSKADAVNPEKVGTKAAVLYVNAVRPAATWAVSLRLCSAARTNPPPGVLPDATFAKRREEADEFYRSVTAMSLSADEANVMRQALSGMLWTKQYYGYDLRAWLGEHGIRAPRNAEWPHMVNDDVISMPDKWEYPWYAAWDLAFHTLSLSLVDVDFAKQQLELMTDALYQHPSGQIPAYEWNFSDVNPPVHAWAAFYAYTLERAARGQGDIPFLKKIFNKLALNFTWWVNRKDRDGKNVFEGGFLGLDNIGVFDRSAPLPQGGYLEQADGTSWMAFFSLNMLEIATELALTDSSFEPMVVKFAEHFLWIAAAINKTGSEGLWDEEDGFYYDTLRLPDGRASRMKVRSVVGLLPLCAMAIVEKNHRDKLPQLAQHLLWRLKSMPDVAASIHPTGPNHLGVQERGILALVGPERLRRVLAYMLDESEFLGPHGIRSVSRYHHDHPYILDLQWQEYRVDYLPAESNTGMFGGNSNWRGPVWMPINVLIVRALTRYYLYYGDNFKVECPTGSGKMQNLYEVAEEINRRIASTFLRDGTGRRPVYGGTEKFQSDPHWRDHILFYEYFHGDNGAGLGASHQTGWTGLVARLLQMHGQLDAKSYLEIGTGAPAQGARP